MYCGLASVDSTYFSENFLIKNIFSFYLLLARCHYPMLKSVSGEGRRSDKMTTCTNNIFKRIGNENGEQERKE